MLVLDISKIDLKFQENRSTYEVYCEGLGKEISCGKWQF